MKQRLIDKFQEIYGEDGPVSVYFAPGRVNLIGDHTDYNGGHVFACAIAIGTYAVARKREDNRFRFYSLNYPEQGILEMNSGQMYYREEDGWGNYSKGVVRTFMKKGIQVKGGLDILYYGEIPKGLGIGSSASLTVVTGLILRDLLEIPDFSMVDIALFSQLTENAYLKTGGGVWIHLPLPWEKRTMRSCWTRAIFLIYMRLCSFRMKKLLLPTAENRVTVWRTVSDSAGKNVRKH